MPRKTILKIHPLLLWLSASLHAGQVSTLRAVSMKHPDDSARFSLSGLSITPQGSQLKAGCLGFQTILMGCARCLFWVIWWGFTFLYNQDMFLCLSRGNRSRESPWQLQPWAGVTCGESLRQPHEEELSSQLLPGDGETAAALQREH